MIDNESNEILEKQKYFSQTTLTPLCLSYQENYIFRNIGNNIGKLSKQCVHIPRQKVKIKGREKITDWDVTTLLQLYYFLFGPPLRWSLLSYSTAIIYHVQSTLYFIQKASNSTCGFRHVRVRSSSFLSFEYVTLPRTFRSFLLTLRAM